MLALDRQHHLQHSGKVCLYCQRQVFRLLTIPPALIPSTPQTASDGGVIEEEVQRESGWNVFEKNIEVVASSTLIPHDVKGEVFRAWTDRRICSLVMGTPDK